MLGVRVRMRALGMRREGERVCGVLRVLLVCLGLLLVLLVGLLLLLLLMRLLVRLVLLLEVLLLLQQPLMMHERTLRELRILSTSLLLFLEMTLLLLHS